MRFFKRLEIHGFKSFANRTLIDFHPGITVIVGPNGCGKSNVFDSIRWVLGEQSARSLRGSRMGDVLFSGSAGTRPAGASKVTLTLDNSVRTLPIEFDEVSIGRRLFRNGDSEYVLNNQSCRLRDISTLLMDTGIGTDGYSVMEQGRVDAIINTKPLERRALFDEAAGIAKYKARKEEALNKLRRTDDDLLRLADVLNEVKGQTNRLHRQAQKAARARRLLDEQQALELELLTRRWFQARLAGASGDEAWNALGERVERLRLELEKIQQDEERLRGLAVNAQDALDVGQEEQLEVARAVQDAQGRVNLFEERLAGYAERRQSIEQDEAISGMEKFGLQAAEADAEAQWQAHLRHLQELEAKLEEARVIFDRLRSEGDSSTKEIAKLRQDISEASRARMDAENRARTAEVMAERARNDLDVARAELQTGEDAVAEAAADVKEAVREREATAAHWAATQSKLVAARDNLKIVEEKLREATQRYDKIRRDRQDVATRHQALERLQESHEGYFRGVKDIMAAAEAGRMKGIVGVAATLIEARPEHEVAIETALGGQAQDIVVETADDGKAAIRFLKETKAGRATFLPLDLLDPRETPDALKRQVQGRPGVVGWATELVKYSAHLRPAVQYLLGGTLVVNHVDTAIELQRQGVRTRLVTLDGEVINPSGAMSGGTVKVAGLLSRTREIKELGTRLETLKREEEKLAKEGQELIAAQQTGRATLEEAQRADRQAEIDAARAKKDAEVAEKEAATVSARIVGLADRRKALDEEIARLDAEATTANELAALLNTRVTELEQALQGMAGEADEHQLKVDAAGKALQETEVAVSTGRERARTLEERFQAARRDLNRIATAGENRAAELQRLATMVAEAQAELDEAKQVLETARAKSKELSDKLAWENQQREAVQLDLRKVHDRSQVVARDFNEAKNELHELELRRAETGVQLEALRLQAQEKFGQPVEDILRMVVRRKQQEAAGAPVMGVAEDDDDLEALKSAGRKPAAVLPVPGVEGEENAADLLDAVGEAVEEPIPEPMDALALLRSVEDLSARLNEVRRSLESLGNVHPGAIDEWREASERLEFLSTQEKDLQDAKGQLTETIAKLDETSRDLFLKAFRVIRDNFGQVFRRLFGGGRADLLLTEENGVLDSGIDVVAMPPGKRLQHISLLSGGEKALTAVALLFAIFLRKPSPFCILDEIDAPLDDKNVERFKEMVREFAKSTQFIIITHNKQTMALADTLYGVTMQEQGVSRVVSVRLDQVDSSGRVTLSPEEIKAQELAAQQAAG